MATKWVEKADGRIEKFNQTKLVKSIFFALHHIDKGNKSLAYEIAKDVASYLEDKEVVESSRVREAVLHVMREKNLHDEAASYELASLHLTDTPITEVIKRDGSKQTFHPIKLFKSTRRACTEAGVAGGKLAEEITKKVIGELSEEQREGSVTTQAIKNTTAKMLDEAGFKAVSRKYVTHRYV